VRAPDLREPLKYEIKASDGSATGGVFVPPGGVREIVASAFDESGTETHRGTQSVYIEGKAIVPRSIRLEPKEAGEPLIVTLSSYHVQLAPQKTSRGTFRVRVNVLDPDGRPANLSPDDVKFGVTDPRIFQLIPFHGGFGLKPGPKPPGELATICDPTQAFACALGVDCSAFRPCADPWAFIAAAGNHTCGITRSGAAFCWGLNTLGELGANSAQTCGGGPCSAKPLPVKCPPGAPCRFKELAASETGTCAIDTNNDAWCWGGGGSVVHQQVRAQLAGAIVKFEDIAVGFAHACAISQDRKELWCWGRNDARALRSRKYQIRFGRRRPGQNLRSLHQRPNQMLGIFPALRQRKRIPLHDVCHAINDRTRTHLRRCQSSRLLRWLWKFWRAGQRYDVWLHAADARELTP
jgi:hypothetical protein